MLVQEPDLAVLEPRSLTDGDVDLAGALVRGGAVQAGRIRINESELRGVTLQADAARGLVLVDVVLSDCGLSNVVGREGQLRRVAARRCRLVGLDLSGADIRDLRVADCSLELASFAGARLRDVSFAHVNLSEVSFQEARLERVEVVDCELAGADFRRASLTECRIRGASLDGVLGIEALRGVSMPWNDVVASAAALAAGLGIQIDEE